jgi:hypothetical protein
MENRDSTNTPGREREDGDEDNEFEPGTIRKPSEDESERIQRTYENPNQRQVSPSEEDTPKTG